ncbi:MAG: oligosaccharide flippase family protein, partial [Cyclobacteriaceae bacterium]
MNAKKLLTSSAIYGILNFLPLASRFFLFPIFVNFLNPFDFGIIGLHATIASFMTILISGGLDSAFSRYYFDYEKDPRQLDQFFKTILVMVFIGGLALGAILMLIGRPVYSLLFEDGRYTFFPYGVYSYLMAFGTSINAIILIYFRNKEQPINYLIFSGSCFLLMVLFETYAIFELSPDADTVLIARLLGLFIPSLVFWFLTIRTGLYFDWLRLKPAFKFGFPIFIYLLLGFFYLNYDRILVSNLLSIGQLSVYNAAITIAAILEISLQAIDMAILPTIYRWYSASEHEKINRLLRYMGLFTLGLISIILVASPSFITKYTPPFYAEALALIPIFIIGYIGRYYLGVMNKPLYFHKKVNQLPLVNIAAGAVLIAGNLLLIPVIGLLGAAISMALSRMIMIPIIIYLAHSKTNQIPQLKAINLYFLILTLLLLGCTFHPHINNISFFSYYLTSTLLA